MAPQAASIFTSHPGPGPALNSPLGESPPGILFAVSLPATSRIAARPFSIAHQGTRASWNPSSELKVRDNARRIRYRISAGPKTSSDEIAQRKKFADDLLIFLPSNEQCAPMQPYVNEPPALRVAEARTFALRTFVLRVAGTSGPHPRDCDELGPNNFMLIALHSMWPARPSFNTGLGHETSLAILADLAFPQREIRPPPPFIFIAADPFHWRISSQLSLTSARIAAAAPIFFDAVISRPSAAL